MKTCCLGMLLAASLLAAQVAQAESQKVFRCGPEGRTYSQTPCKDGYEVNVDDQRSAEQRKAAGDIVKREEKATEKMIRERQAKEAAAAKQGSTASVKSASARPASSAASSGAAHRKPTPKQPAPTQP